MKKNQKIIAIIIGAVALLSVAATIILIVITNTKDPEPEIDETPVVECPIEDGVVTIAGQEGQTALDILVSLCEVESTPTTNGETIHSIDGISTGDYEDGAYWAMYVNDSPALLSASKFLATETDIIYWQLETTNQ